jgi:hypothetical protein
MIRRAFVILGLMVATLGCYGTDFSAPSAPENPSVPPTPRLVGAVLYGTLFTNQSLSTSFVTFEVLNLDCTAPIEGVSAENKLPGKKKFTYKWQLTVERLPFQACVRVRANYAYGPDDPVQVVERTAAVYFNAQGAGVAPVGIQVDLPLPR